MFELRFSGRLSEAVQWGFTQPRGDALPPGVPVSVVSAQALPLYVEVFIDMCDVKHFNLSCIEVYRCQTWGSKVIHCSPVHITNGTILWQIKPYYIFIPKT